MNFLKKLTKNSILISHLFGFNSKKRYNFHILDNENIIFIAGITFQIFNINTKKYQVFYSKDKGGIGSICVHPTKNYFAVAEKGKIPNIYIYEYPSLKIYRILEEGTEKSYSNVSFSNDGNKLASVGSESDYNLCVWDWKNEVQILKTKAFSQEVFKVNFSIFDDNILCTSGLAHIRFWKIAETFTGLKLKGETGKFGQTELSDISGFLILQNGKVLSGTETGSLLLWEGNFIKTVINISNEQTCHKGFIEVVKFYKDFIITAGEDSFIKFWNYNEIEDIEGDDDLNSYINPKLIIEVNSLKSYIFDIIYKDEKNWFIHDGNGKLINLNIINLDIDLETIIFKIGNNKFTKNENEKKILELRKKLLEEEDEENINLEEIESNIKNLEKQNSEFDWNINIRLEENIILELNSGRINDLSLCKTSNVAVTIGDDGYIRLLDFCNKFEINKKKFLGKGTCIDWRNINFDDKDRIIAAGFNTGFVRIIILQDNELELLDIKRVHNSSIESLKYSPNGNILSVFSENELFLFKIVNEKPYDHIPYCYIKLNNNFNYFVYNRFSTHLLIGYKNGNIEEIKLFEEKECNYEETFLRTDIEIKSKTIMMMESQKPQKDDDYFLFEINENLEPFDIEWDPTSITSLLYYNENCNEFLACAEGNFIGYIYKCDFESERPILFYKGPKHIVKLMKYTDDNKILLCGCDNGEIHFFDRYNEEYQLLLYLKNHDQDIGSIVNVFIYNEKLLLSASQDGTFIVKNIDYNSILSEEKKDLSFTEVNELEIDEKFYLNKKNAVIPKDDILDLNIYSIQEEKLKAEKDKKKKIAEENKKKIKAELNLLINEFKDLKEKNYELKKEFQLDDLELIVDPEYKKLLEERNQEELNEKRKEVLWEKLYHKKKNLKLLNFYYKELEINEKEQKILNNLYMNEDKNLLDSIEINKFCIKKIKSDDYLTLFKIKKFSKFIEDKINEINRIIQNEKNEKDDNNELLEDDKNDLSFEFKRKNKEKKNILEIIKGKVKLEQSKEIDEKITKEKIKKTKEKRKKMLLELEEKQPKKKDVLKNPEIIEAERNMGDYKLKIDLNYEVSFKDRMNISKQEKHIILLERFIYNAKKDFNKNFYKLKEWKNKLIEKIKTYNEKIRNINKSLNVDEELFEPVIDEVIENPKNIFKISEQEILDLKKSKEDELKNKKKGMFGNMDDNINNEVENEINNNKDNNQQQNNFDNLIIKSKERKNRKLINKSIFFNKIENMNKKNLLQEKNYLKNTLEEEINKFDKMVDDLKNDKIILEYESKMINMKLVIWFQELIEFEVLEEQDNNYLKEHIDKKEEIMKLNKEKSDKIHEIADLSGVLKNYENEIEKVKKQFIEIVGKGDPELSSRYYELFKKHKNKNNDDMNDDGEEYDDENEKMNEYEDQKLEEDALKKFTLEEVIDIYTKRFELETKIVATKENIKRNTYESDNLDEKITIIQNDLEEITIKLNDIQKVKLQRISKIYVSFFLKLSQIMNLNDSDEIKLPNNLNDSILFTNEYFEQLCNRINILHKEKIAIYNKSKDLKSLKEDLSKEINYLKEAYNEARDELKENYQLKFGRIIDLNEIDSLEPSEKLKELKREYDRDEKNCLKRIDEADKRMLESKKKLIELKQENTSIINKITELGTIQLNLDKTLNSKNNQLLKDEKEDKVQNTKLYRKDLLQIVKLLSKEIDDLQNEIIFYKNKGGLLSQINKNDIK